MIRSYLLLCCFVALSSLSAWASDTEKAALIQLLSKANDAEKTKAAMLSYFSSHMAGSEDLSDLYNYADHIASDDGKVHIVSWPPQSTGKDDPKTLMLQQNDGNEILSCRILDLELDIEEFLPAQPVALHTFQLVEGTHYMLQLAGQIEEENSQYHVMQLYESDGFTLCNSCMTHAAELIIEKPADLDLQLEIIPRIGRIMYQDYELHKRKKIYQPLSRKTQFKLVNNVFLEVE